MISRFAIAVSLAFALAACGSSDQPSDEATGAAATSEVAAPAAVGSGAVPNDTPSAAASATPAVADKHTDKDEDDDDHPAGSPQAFNQCTACHSTTPGKTIIGPSLAGVYGHKAGQVPGFQFTDALKNSGMVLNEKNLDAFLTDPMAKVPGTTMAFAGIKDEDQREAIIDYLKTLK